MATVLIVAALILFVIAAFAWPSFIDNYRVRIIAAGLAAWVASTLIPLLKS
jgi:hypothetical protein